MMMMRGEGLPGSRSLRLPAPSGIYSVGPKAMEVIVYSSRWCPDCREAKRFLAKHNISYREIDIEKVPGAAEEIIQRTGKRAIPQFVINGTWVQPYHPDEGFLYDEMSKLLGVREEV
jgi:mycoredoxin